MGEINGERTLLQTQQVHAFIQGITADADTKRMPAKVSGFRAPQCLMTNPRSSHLASTFQLSAARTPTSETMPNLTGTSCQTGPSGSEIARSSRRENGSATLPIGRSTLQKHKGANANHSNLQSQHGGDQTSSTQQGGNSSSNSNDKSANYSFADGRRRLLRAAGQITLMLTTSMLTAAGLGSWTMLLNPMLFVMVLV